MATPAFQLQTKSFTIPELGKTTLTFNVKDEAGVAIDVSAGYTAAVLGRPSSSPNQQAAQTNIGALGTFAYNADGTIVLTLDQNDASSLESVRYNYLLLVSNDAFATQGAASKGSITIDSSGAGA